MKNLDSVAWGVSKKVTCYLRTFVDPIRNAIKQLVFFSVISDRVKASSNSVQPIDIVILNQSLSVKENKK